MIQGLTKEKDWPLDLWVRARTPAKPPAHFRASKHRSRIPALALAAALALSLGCGRSAYRRDLSEPGLVRATESPLLQAELAEAARQAAAGLSLDALAGETVVLEASAMAGADAAQAVRHCVAEELLRRGCRLIPPQDPDAAEAVWLDIFVEEWGVERARSGWLRTRQLLVVRAALRSTARVPGLEALADRSEATRRVDYAAGWLGFDRLASPVAER
jgi:hypothetical protein